MAGKSTVKHSLYDIGLTAHLVVERFLLDNKYHETAAAFRRDVEKTGTPLPQGTSSSFDLNTLVEAYSSSLEAENQARLQASFEATHSSRSVIDPLSLGLPGPLTLPFQLVSTHQTLHASNILSVQHLFLPRRIFDTSAPYPRYCNSLTKCVVTTAADKRIVFSDSETGQIEEILEADDELNCRGHQAAILSVIQDPSNPCCLVSSGMDAKVVVWDLWSRKPVQVLNHHSKFVVRLAFSPTGDYFASAGYDRKIIVYKRVHPHLPAVFSQQSQHGDLHGQDDPQPPPLETPVYEKVFEKETKTNPEAILFVRAGSHPPSGDMEQNLQQQKDGHLLVKEAKHKRTWLAFTVRNDSFIHYIALPQEADQAKENTDATEHLSQSMQRASIQDVNVDVQAQAADWSVHSFNTNPNPEDLHVSYSLLSLSLHPSKMLICAQTGDHMLPNTASSSSTASLSRLLLLPFLSSQRAATIWTGVPTSAYANPRHCWLPSGRGCWLNSEDGILRLVDLKGNTRAQVHCHGLVESEQSQEDNRDDVQRVVAWTRGGNTIIKDVVALDENTIASCGFDKTVRIVRLNSDILE